MEKFPNDPLEVFVVVSAVFVVCMAGMFLWYLGAV
jgi:hypothetical protein